ncbi:MAG: hypothetical protein JJU19_11615 [Pararhodobacter sp.]|nr:hypothetical protein [Pararhodobacter sp.]
MSRTRRSHLMLSTACALLLLPFSATAPVAQEAGFAVQLSAPDRFTSPRADVQVFGQTVESAGAYVRGCGGYVAQESAAAVFDLIDRLPELAFTAAGEGLAGMVLGTPDGLYRCALSDDSRMVSAQIANATPGRYRVWVATEEEGAELDARLVAADRAIPGLELFGLDVSALNAPRAGRHVFAATADSGRQVLTDAGTLFPETPMRPLNPEYCPGFGRFDAADAVLTLDAPESLFSIFAMSPRDLTLAVVAPDGSVSCNDDTFGLHPAVSFENAQPGDYQIFVGAFSQGGTAQYELFASQGGPAFVDVQFDVGAAPRHGHATLDSDLGGRAQQLATAQVVSRDPFSALPIGSYCPGYTGIDAPDLVLTLDAPERQFSLMALSQTDLVMAVRLPDGSWACNDDSYGLNPGITLNDAPAGDYMIYVGTFGQGRSGEFGLFASLGQQNWQDAEGGGADDRLRPDAEPAVGYIDFGPQTRDDPRIVFDVMRSTQAAFGMGPGCAGYIVTERPDIVISAEAGLPQMMIYMVSQADGTLVVVGPDGQMYCNDDFEGLHPGIVFQDPLPGDYAVFAGTYGGRGGVATLGVTISNPQWVMDRAP